MRNIGIGLLLLLSLNCALYASKPLLHSPDYATPGEVIQISIRGTLLEDMSAALANSQGIAISRSEGFLWSAPNRKRANVALLGVPSEAFPGEYTLTVQADEDGAHWNLSKTIIVREHIYPKNIIQLSNSMENLYNDDSERKKREARALWAILNESNPGAVYFFGTFIPPVAEGLVTSDFGERRILRQLNMSESSTIHNGQDLWNTLRTPVVAAGKGRVVLTEERLLTGNSVVIEHLPGIYTIYFHLDSISVDEGLLVEQGAEIGELGDTGFVTGEHLHWELRVGGVPVYPSQFFSRPLLDTDALKPISSKGAFSE